MCVACTEQDPLELVRGELVDDGGDELLADAAAADDRST